MQSLLFKVLQNKYATFAVRTLIGIAFIAAGTLKLQDPRGFAMVIGGYELTPGWMDLKLAYIIPAVEILSGAALIFRIKGAALIVALQLVGFIAVLTYGQAIGLDAGCGCFGEDSGLSGGSNIETILRDLGMLAGCIWIMAANRHQVLQSERLR